MALSHPCTFCAQMGVAVEVHNNEEGLKGCWFSGLIVSVSPAAEDGSTAADADLRACWALVKYDDLRASDEDGERCAVHHSWQCL